MHALRWTITATGLFAVVSTEVTSTIFVYKCGIEY